jgi:hypothetical protein
MKVIHEVDISNFSYHLNCPICGKPYFDQKLIGDNKYYLPNNELEKIKNNNSFTVKCCHLKIEYRVKNKNNIKILNDEQIKVEENKIKEVGNAKV